MKRSVEELATIDPADRILLLSHCLRPSQSCPGKFGKEGLVCPTDCREDCVVGRLQKAALDLGYKGVCIAAGGSMALRFALQTNPRGVVAVACTKELVEGVERVQEKMNGRGIPTLVPISLLVEGCVDTKVDEALVLEVLAVGCDPVVLPSEPVVDERSDGHGS